MNARSYAIETSPAAVNEYGVAAVIPFSATLKSDVLLSEILKILPASAF